MHDLNVNWRNLRWSIDAQYVEVEAVPIIDKQLKKYRKFWDGEFWYKRKGKTKRYVVKWPDWRNKLNLPMERPKDPFQQKL